MSKLYPQSKFQFWVQFSKWISIGLGERSWDGLYNQLNDQFSLDPIDGQLRGQMWNQISAQLWKDNDE